MIKALGIHGYLGGFSVGVKRNSNIQALGSIETWQPAVTWSPRLGVDVLSAVQLADYVYANPPCARFSAMSYSKFDDSMREELSSFPEMLDVVNTANESGADLVHVESGPMLFSKGATLIEQFGDALNFTPYILTIKVSTSYAGLPQSRIRTHVFFGRRPFPEMDLTAVPLPENVGAFLKDWNSKYNFEPVPSSQIPDPMLYASMEKDRAVFLSTRPKIISLYDKATYSVVSSRHFVLAEEKRWFSVDEYAAIQGYDADGFNYAEPGIPLAMALISKSVSPCIAEYLTERIVVPYFDSGARDKHPNFQVNLA